MVREPQVEDADALGRVHVRAWQAAYRGGLMPDAYLDGLKAEDRAAIWATALAGPPRPSVARFVADVDGDVVGFVVVGPEEVGSDVTGSPGRTEVYVINVDPDYWGSGAAAQLFDAGVSALQSFGFDEAVLWVHPENLRARAFYERRGWSPDGRSRCEAILGVGVPEVRYTATIVG